MKKLGILQSRGLGDILIAIPICHYYYTNPDPEEQYEIYFPILEEFLPSVQFHVPWINWIPIKQTSDYFYQIPYNILNSIPVDTILPLYQSLSNHPEFTEEPYFQHTSFDEYKYCKASVPLLHKWKLNQCITRNKEKENTLLKKLRKYPSKPLVTIHLDGSDYKASFDYSMIPEDWEIIKIKPIPDYSIFDWLSILEESTSIITVDSAFANLIDQMQIQKDLYFIPRSHIGLTPTLGLHWTWLHDPNIPKHTKIFKSA